MSLPKFFDPHFHFWNTTGESPNWDPKILGPPAAMHPVYTAEMLRDEFAEVCELTGAVHIEAIPKDGAQEARDVIAGRKLVPVALVPRVELWQEDAEEQLAKLVKAHGTENIKGIRVILNWEPTWPKVDRGDFLTSADFEKGYAALAKNNLSFDLQANPHQLKDAAALAAKYPQVPLIINHFGTLKLKKDASDEETLRVWRKGMQALAGAGAHVYLKLSMLCYTDPDWDKEGSVVPALVKEMLELFGAERCMFASNYPVDKADGVGAKRLWAGFARLAKGLSEEQRDCLFFKTAKKAYRI